LDDFRKPYPLTIDGECNTLRAFFYYTETQNWRARLFTGLDDSSHFECTNRKQRFDVGRGEATD
jgi:hypothetical protein